MNRKELDELLAHHGLKVDGAHTGEGKFRDLEVGVGAIYAVLLAAQADLSARKVASHITYVTNTDHADHGKPYLEIPSFWDE